MNLLDVDHLGPEELRPLVRQKSGKGLWSEEATWVWTSAGSSIRVKKAEGGEGWQERRLACHQGPAGQASVEFAKLKPSAQCWSQHRVMGFNVAVT